MEQPLKINDTKLRMIGIPSAAILIFHLSGFENLTGLNMGSRVANYLYFSLITFCLWNGNVQAHMLVRNKLSQISKIYLRIPARYTVTIIVSWIISFCFLEVWNFYFARNQFPFSDIVVSQTIMTLISIQISSIYEIVYLNKERESDLVKMERTEKLKIQAQLDALKSQIDPHFIFNSLNTLSYLITHSAEKAKHFNDTLAKVYRYILVNKEKDLISLSEEIEFASNYFYLLKIRYQTGLSFTVKMENVGIENYLIPPLSLQTLIENAIKHNHFSDKNILTIEIIVSEKVIKVINPKSLKKFDIQSSRIGLHNLNERYKLILNDSLTINETENSFVVILPTLKLKSDD